MKYVGIMAVGLALVLAGCKDEAPKDVVKEEVARPAKIAVAQTHAFESIKTFPGITEATRSSVLAFRVAGQVVELPQRTGQLVKKGALIARLDDSDYRNTLADRQAKFDLAKTELDRQKILFKKKHIAKSKLDSAQSNFDAAEAALKQAKDDLSYTRLTAPYAGIISRINIDNFQNVQAKEPIASYQGAKDIDVVFNVPESLFLLLNQDNTNGGRVKVRFDSMPDRSFDAQYREHETIPDATTRSFKVTVTMPRPTDLTVLPGMSVTVVADLSQVFKDDSQGVLVPVESVFEEAGKTWVWKLDAELRANRTAVVPAGIEGDKLRLTQGLSDGDKIIAVGVAHVQEGQKVRPMVKERGL